MSFYSYLSNSQLTILKSITMAVLNDAGAENVFKHLAREITEVSFAFYAQTFSQTVQFLIIIQSVSEIG